MVAAACLANCIGRHAAASTPHVSGRFGQQVHRAAAPSHCQCCPFRLERLLRSSELDLALRRTLVLHLWPHRAPLCRHVRRR